MTPKQQMMLDYLDGKMTNVEIIEAWDRQRQKNKRYHAALKEILETDDYDDALDYIDLVNKIASGAIGYDSY